MTNTGLNSGQSNAVTFAAIGEPLATPVITLNNATGIVTWTGGEARITRVYSGNGVMWTSPAPVSQVDLNQVGITGGIHQIRIRHLHGNNDTLHSERSNAVLWSLPSQLPTPTITLTGNTLTWTGGTQIVRVYSGEAVLWTSPAAIGQLDLNQFGTAGATLQLRIRHINEGNPALNSGLSNVVAWTPQAPASGVELHYAVWVNEDTTVSLNIGHVPVGNHHRITAISADGARVGGRLDTATGMFSFTAQTSDAHTVNYVENLRRLTLQLGGYQITDLAGNAPQQNMDVAAQTVEGRTMIPMRFMAYALGAEVDYGWSGDWMWVSLTMDDTTLRMYIGYMSDELAAMGMDVAPQLLDGRTMLPLRFISEFFGATVLWHGDTMSVEVIR